MAGCPREQAPHPIRWRCLLGSRGMTPATASSYHAEAVVLISCSQYEDALKELLKKKQEGKPIERPERPKPTKVVNLMEALRRSVEAGDAPTSSKPKPNTPARRAGNEKAEQPKRKKTRRTG
jgi:hypothetical protein